jgi:Zn-dependent membrane protease YugP
MVPTVSIASKLSGGIIIAGLFIQSFPILLPLGIILFAATVVFSFVTLPVEYDASNRALAWLDNENMLTPEEHAGAKDALSWAARTYVVAAIGAMATLLYYVMIYMGRD